MVLMMLAVAVVAPPLHSNTHTETSVACFATPYVEPPMLHTWHGTSPQQP
jgi:hypothetical protein